MNTEQLIELFLMHMHRHMVKLLEVYVWLEHVSKWRTGQQARPEDHQTERDIRHRMRDAVCLFSLILRISQQIGGVRRSSVSLSVMEGMVRRRVQEMEDQVKEYDARCVESVEMV